MSKRTFPMQIVLEIESPEHLCALWHITNTSTKDVIDRAERWEDIPYNREIVDEFIMYVWKVADALVTGLRLKKD